MIWDFYAVHHVENHPRWDESIELEATSHGPIGVGTVIKRRVTRFGSVTDGTMEVVEFEPVAEQIRTMMGRSVANIKALVESET